MHISTLACLFVPVAFGVPSSCIRNERPSAPVLSDNAGDPFVTHTVPTKPQKLRDMTAVLQARLIRDERRFQDSMHYPPSPPAPPGTPVNTPANTKVVSHFARRMTLARPFPSHRTTADNVLHTRARPISARALTLPKIAQASPRAGVCDGAQWPRAINAEAGNSLCQESVIALKKYHSA